ncbi:MAG: cobalt transporter CbiM [Lachnospiraceae bacterium]|nr:cobalt transporter CbiM [Lachnospiraceae bacterium]
MHIPENYLSPATCAVMTAAMVPVWVRAVKNVKTELPKEKISMIGVGAAFSFVGMMFNVPMPGGTTGHAVGGTLLAALLGPDAACIAVSMALLLQALIFGDGGILAFGANAFNMAFAMPYIGFAIYSLLLKLFKAAPAGKEQMTKKLVSAGVGSYVGINAAAFLAAIEFGIQPYLFKDAAGRPMYCPYGLNVSIPSMMIGHLTIFGLAEIIFTVAILAYVLKTSPNLVHGALPTHAEGEKKKRFASMLPLLLAILIAFVPLGLLAEGTAWGEWGSDEIAEVVSDGETLGYVPSGMESGFSLEAIIPDYAIEGVPDIVGYIASAIIGVAVLVIIFRLIGSVSGKKKVHEIEHSV